MDPEAQPRPSFRAHGFAAPHRVGEEEARVWEPWKGWRMGAYWTLDDLRRLTTRRPVRDFVLFLVAGILLLLIISLIQDWIACPLNEGLSGRARQQCQEPWETTNQGLAIPFLLAGIAFGMFVLAHFRAKRIRRRRGRGDWEERVREEAVAKFGPDGFPELPKKAGPEPPWYNVQENGEILVFLAGAAKGLCGVTAVLGLFFTFFLHVDEGMAVKLTGMVLLAASTGFGFAGAFGRRGGKGIREEALRLLAREQAEGKGMHAAGFEPTNS